jgi:hypothetical protein
LVEGGNAERGSSGDESERVRRQGKALKESEPQERQRDETSLQGSARIKSSRTCERSKRKGVRVEPDNS